MPLSLEEQLDRAHRVEREAQDAWLDAVRRGARNHHQLWESWDRRIEELHELGERVCGELREQK